MIRSEGRREVALEEGFNIPLMNTSSLSHRTKYKGKEIQHAAMISVPHQRPRPGRRRLSVQRLPLNLTQIFLFVTMILSVLCQPIEAVEHPASQGRAVQGHFVDGSINIDQHRVSQPALQRREDPASTTTASTTTATVVPETSDSDSSTTLASLPLAFDGGFGTNYTQPSCPTFLRSMVNNETFISCVPFSLLLQNSMSFFDASRSHSSITAVLNASCSVFFPTCSALMSSFAATLRSPTACQDDYGAENPQVRQAYAGLLAYDVAYSASCLKEEDTPTPPGDDPKYCFANAITNQSSPSDSYVYYLPLGMALPSDSRPTCGPCLARTMAVYAGAASNRSQPLNLDYVASATTVNERCGPAFVNASVPNAGLSSAGKSSSSSAASRADAAWLGLLVAAAAAALIAAL